MEKTEVYKTVYEAITKEAAKPDCKVIEGHKNFAKKLPNPGTVPEEDAGFCSAMVVYSPSNGWVRRLLWNPIRYRGSAWRFRDEKHARIQAIL